jgi:hypothetical protein
MGVNLKQTSDKTSTRDNRVAAALRENLRKRKNQN